MTEEEQEISLKEKTIYERYKKLKERVNRIEDVLRFDLLKTVTEYDERKKKLRGMVTLVIEIVFWAILVGVAIGLFVNEWVKWSDEPWSRYETEVVVMGENSREKGEMMVHTPCIIFCCKTCVLSYNPDGAISLVANDYKKFKGGENSVVSRENFDEVPISFFHGYWWERYMNKYTKGTKFECFALNNDRSIQMDKSASHFSIEFEISFFKDRESKAWVNNFISPGIDFMYTNRKVMSEKDLNATLDVLPKGKWYYVKAGLSTVAIEQKKTIERKIWYWDPPPKSWTDFSHDGMAVIAEDERYECDGYEGRYGNCTSTIEIDFYLSFEKTEIIELKNKSWYDPIMGVFAIVGGFLGLRGTLTLLGEKLFVRFSKRSEERLKKKTKELKKIEREKLKKLEEKKKELEMLEKEIEMEDVDMTKMMLGGEGGGSNMDTV